MGTVYLAEHLLIKRKVAVKLLHPEFADDPSVIERFMNEARAAGTLGHPNIVESTDMGFTDGAVPYIVFEYLEGTLLTDEIYRLGGLPIRRAVRIAQKMASALQAAHTAGIVHRDLKSDNIFLTDKDDLLDHVKVLDFGISRFMEVDDEQTRRGMVMGTPEFMAPEQITSPNSVDARADIYALGVILYEMLGAKRPFQNDDQRTLLHRIVHDEPPLLDRSEAPRELIELVMCLLAKEPSKRLGSMMEVEAALDALFTKPDVQPGRPSSKVLWSEPGGARPLSAADAGNNDIARRSRPELLTSNAGKTPWPGLMSPGSMPLSKKSSMPKHWRAISAGSACLVLSIAGLWSMLKTKTGASPVTAAPVELPAVAQQITIKLESDNPKSRVTFRRRVSAAPAEQTIAPSTIIEMVEVSAPDHKTVRYWLTFDRNTHLIAKLPLGSGLVEASEEDTLIALGELPGRVANPVAAARVALPVAGRPKTVEAQTGQIQLANAPMKTVANNTRLPPTPRKIGRGADEPATQNDPVALVQPETNRDSASLDAHSAQTQVPISIESENTKPLVPEVAASAKPMAPAENAAMAAEVSQNIIDRPAAGSVNPPIVAPATELTPVDALAATRPTPDLVSPPLVPAKPTIAQNVVASVVAAHRSEILGCFAKGKKQQPDLKGVVTVTLAVTPDGYVSRPQVQSTLGAPMVAACVAAAVGAWKFPARQGTGLAKVSYPFTLN
jgi:serine/threonine protein kinase